jgi:hypothetical protein
MTSTKFVAARLGAALVVGTILAGTVAAGDVNGIVLDYYFRTPIPGAQVGLNSDTGNKTPINPPTAADGTYGAQGVTNGNYTLEAAKPGYTQVPQEPPQVTIGNGPNTLPSVTLRLSQMNGENAKANGIAFAKHYKDMSAEEKTKAYAGMWHRLALGNVSPIAKYRIGKSIASVDESASADSPPLKLYLGISDEKNLAQAVLQFGDIVDGKSEIPAKSTFTDTLKLQDSVLKEVMLYQVRAKGTKESNERLFQQLDAESDWKQLANQVEAEHRKLSAPGSSARTYK